MIDDVRQAENAAPRWTASAPQSPKSDTPLNRFLGGAPATVAVRLLFVSLLVGALLMWLDLRPIDIFNGVLRFFDRLWTLGFGAVHEVAAYVVAGAVIVVPVWLVLRLMQMRQANR